MKNGATVQAFESEFAQYVGAKYVIAASNGTVTLQTALVALGVKTGDRVAVPPLTMAATSIAVLNVGAVPVFVDVDERMWLVDPMSVCDRLPPFATPFGIPVSLYGLHWPTATPWTVDDAAQTLRPHNQGAAFTSYSLQNSKILSTGEGGMLATNDEALAARARSYLSLGYKLDANQPRIDPATLKAPTFERHHSLGINGRMNDITASLGLGRLKRADRLLANRYEAAGYYRDAIAGCSWITPQFVPEGWTHDYWTYAVALDTPERWTPFTNAIVRHGGEMPYGAWALTYREPAFRHLVKFSERVEAVPFCPVAARLQPRLCQMQTNDLAAAERNARAVRAAIRELGA